MKSYALFYLSILFVFMGCNDPKNSSSGAEENEEVLIAPVFHASHLPKKQNAPFSDVVQVGNTFYLAGQIGMNEDRKLVAGGIKEETRQTLENIKAVLAQHGLQMSNVVKATVILDEISDFQAFNEVYVQYFPQKPARTTFAAESLAVGAKIEIEVIAVRH